MKVQHEETVEQPNDARRYECRTANKRQRPSPGQVRREEGRASVEGGVSLSQLEEQVVRLGRAGSSHMAGQLR